MTIGLALTGCGDEGLKSDPLTGRGSGSGGQVSNAKLVVSMALDPSSGLGVFAGKAKQLFGMKTDMSHFGVESAKVTLDIGTSSGLMYFENAYNGSITISLKPASGTSAAVPVAIIKSPKGNGALAGEITADQRQLDNIKDAILSASLVVETSGGTPWNQAETKKIGLITTLVLEAIGPP